MRRRRLPVEVSDRLWGIAGVAIVIAGSVWGLLDAGQSPSTVARSSPAPSIPVSTASTLPLTATATVPPGTYPAIATHPEAFAGLGRLAYVSAGQLFILDGAGDPPRPVPGAVDVAGARWSHDGEWLAYQETAASGSGQLHVVRADGSRAHGIGAPGEIRTWAWSPTADVIAYIRGTATVSTTASVDWSTRTEVPPPSSLPACAPTTCRGRPRGHGSRTSSTPAGNHPSIASSSPTSAGARRRVAARPRRSP